MTVTVTAMSALSEACAGLGQARFRRAGQRQGHGVALAGDGQRHAVRAGVDEVDEVASGDVQVPQVVHVGLRLQPGGPPIVLTKPRSLRVKTQARFPPMKEFRS